jgi:hypothetical protein
MTILHYFTLHLHIRILYYIFAEFHTVYPSADRYMCCLSINRGVGDADIQYTVAKEVLIQDVPYITVILWFKWTAA